MADASGGGSRQQRHGKVPQKSLDGKSYDMTIDPRIADLDERRLDYFSSAVGDLIGKRIDGIQYAENRRSQIVVIAGAVVAAGVALLTLGLQTQWLPLRVSYLVAACLSILVGVLVWLIFMLQTNFRYPFVEPAQTWKWFYWQALPDATRFGPGIGAIQREDERAAEKIEYQRQWEIFRHQISGLSDKRVNATQDLKQLYLLHVDERYKNLFLTHLRRLLAWGIAAVIVVTLATFSVALSLIGISGPPLSSEITRGEVQIKSSWVPTGAAQSVGISKADVQFRLVVTVTNHGAAVFTSSRLIAEDGQGTPIPAIFHMTSRISFVRPGQSATLLGYFWIAGVDQANLRKVELR